MKNAFSISFYRNCFCVKQKVRGGLDFISRRKATVGFTILSFGVIKKRLKLAECKDAVVLDALAVLLDALAVVLDAFAIVLDARAFVLDARNVVLDEDAIVLDGDAVVFDACSLVLDGYAVFY